MLRPVACAINGLEKMHLEDNGGRMIIFGAGPIGINMGMIAQKYYGVDEVDFESF